MDTELWCEECTSCQELQLHFRDSSEHSHKASNHWLFFFCQSQLPRGTGPSKYQGLTRQHTTVLLSYTHIYPTKPTFAIISLWVFSSTFFCQIFPCCPRPRSAFLPFASTFCPLPLSSQPCPRCLSRRDGYGKGGSGKGRDPRSRTLLSPHSRAPPGMGAPGPAPPRALRRRNPARVEAGAGRAKSGGR